MKIVDIIHELELFAPLSLQEKYDNAGLLTGDKNWICSGSIISLDVTEAVVNEAIQGGCNLIIAHHPVIFSGLKKITGSNYVEKTIIAAIKNDIAIYAIHTNLDNLLTGVNKIMADKLGLVNRKVLLPKINTLKKLVTFVPGSHLEIVREALFTAGAGDIGLYSECSYDAKGQGTFKASEGAQPFIGKIGERHYESEHRLEVIFPYWKQSSVLKALKAAHCYEEVSYDVISLDNQYENIGSGLVGELPAPMDEVDFLSTIKMAFKTSVIKHTQLLGKQVKTVALCGGAGSFLIGNAISAEADFYITSDIKYHEFFESNGKVVLADIGHYESEQFTIDLLFDILKQKFPNFAVQKTTIITNPVSYFKG